MLTSVEEKRKEVAAKLGSKLKRKLRILAIKPNDGGCGYYRCILPFRKLGTICNEFVEVIIMQNPLAADKEKRRFVPDWDFYEMKWADVVMVSNINNYGGQYTIDIIRKAHELGKFIHFDTDDLLTDLYKEHRLYNVYQDQKLSEMTKVLYNNSHLVTVTQTKFAEQIKPFIRGVLGITRNAIDFSLPAWNQPKTKDKKVRIGWAGGIHHRPDVKVFAGVPALVNQRVGQENVIWDFYGHPPPGQPESENWQIDAWGEYKQSLLLGMKGKPNYRIHNALPPEEYGVFYANMDIAIAPLANNVFNQCKCFGKGEKVLMFDGSVKNVENIVVGDRLMGPDLEQRNVLALSSGISNLYKLKYKNSEAIIVTGNHILYLDYKGKIEYLTVEDLLKKKNAHEYKLVSVGKNAQVIKFTVEYIGVGEYYGFEVDKDSLHLMDDFIVTHNSEIKLAECSAYAVPLVASNIGCYSDVIKNGKNGYLLPVDAKASDWVNVLSKFIKDKQYRESNGQELAKYKPFYDINYVVWDRLNLYCEVFNRIGWEFK